MKNKSNIVLIGFMGCGKSTIGKELAKKIKYSFIDSDEEIEKSIGISISDFFAKYGEVKFRKLEEKVISQIAAKNNLVIATGGGVIKNFNNIFSLKSGGIIIYLKAAPMTIFKNVKNDNTRPLLNTNNKLETIKSLLNERAPLYERAADFIVNTDNKSINEIISNILDYIRG
ncbi:shikimate kinase [Defluviitalea phaphyphila]|uniref:shikimate kinase n=1 Tax=Defluviitalea phaphyphila TaxID=1473580 RepID=UPI000731312B|nr:shikimate kinase [Defluviitalea phaphyphila]